MALATWFWKHYNSGVTKGLSGSPLRKRFSKYRRTRLARKQGFEGAKKIQDVEGIEPPTRQYIMPFKGND